MTLDKLRRYVLSRRGNSHIKQTWMPIVPSFRDKRAILVSLMVFNLKRLVKWESPPFPQQAYNYLPLLLQAYNAGLNFANVDEARNFINEIEKKLHEKLQRRQGKKIEMEIDRYVICTCKWTRLNLTLSIRPLPYNGHFILG